MLSPLELIRYQIDSAAWANKRVLAAALKLTPHQLTHDFKTSEHSVLATLVHMYRAERVWLARLNDKPVDFVSPNDDSMAALSTNWPRLSDDWANWAHTADPSVEITYHDLRKNLHTQPIWQIVLHVVNHSTHHRGQVIGFIRALGHEPPNTDSITYAREQKSLRP